MSASVALSALSAFGKADTVDLHRDDVIPVVMQNELSFSRSHEGDTFKAEVIDSHMLPTGSRLEGVVNRVEQKHGDHKAFMDIEFTTIILPDGTRTRFHGTPIPLSKNYVMQDRDGRWEAKKGVSRETVVLGATAGGLVLGSLIHKPFEGAFVGALFGILAGETDKEDIGDGNVVVPKGSKVGARVGEDLSIHFDGRWDNHGANEDRYGPYDKDGYNSAGYDRYGYDHRGHYNPAYDSAHDAGTDKDGYNSAGYDKYGYDRNGHYNPDYDTTRDKPVQGRDSGYDKYGFDKNGHYNPDYDTTRDHPAPNRSGGDLGGLHIEIGRTALRYSGDAQPYRDGWLIMVPLRSTAEQLGYRVSDDEAEASFRIEDDKDVLVLEQDSRSYSLNHRRDSLPAKVTVRDGVAYAPIDAFTVLTKSTVVVNGTKYRQ
ncbi:MAG TPA: stalk domain-containing protein [Fimbriimonadaceae bacterium]|nr:stalk domain-containing protein [Fimbriimonadaceae bacterium]